MTHEIFIGDEILVVSDTWFKYCLKKPVLALRKDNVVFKLASFNDEESMKRFLKVFRAFSHFCKSA